MSDNQQDREKWSFCKPLLHFGCLTKEKCLKEKACASLSAEGQGWVKVEDRLPAPKTRVIFWDGWDVREGYLNGENCWQYMDNDERDYQSGFTIVTHWQPLPASPVTDKKERI